MKIQSSPQKINIVATSIASSFASMIARFVMHPVDTMKAKVQVSKNSLKSVSDYKVGMVTNLSNFLSECSQANLQKLRSAWFF